MATITTANARQTHEALYRQAGMRATITLTSGSRLRVLIYESRWRTEPGLHVAVDGEGGVRVIPHGSIHSVTLEG
jgi:hypothetical protein